jgi:hypothetical protein
MIDVTGVIGIIWLALICLVILTPFIPLSLFDLCVADLARRIWALVTGRKS